MESSNVVRLSVGGKQKGERRNEVEASMPKIERLARPGRYYVIPAQRIHTRIPPMLHVRVSAKGLKAWAVSVRVKNQKTGKRDARRDITLGRFPALSLGDAIEQAQRLWEQADSGDDPKAGEVYYRAAAATVPSVETLLETFEKKAPQRSRVEMVRSIRFGLQHILPTSAALIGPNDVVPALKSIGQAGHKPTAVRLRSYIASFQKWVAQEYDYGLEDWVAGYEPTATKGIRERHLSWDEVSAVLAAADKQAPYWRNLVHMLMLSGLRLREAANAEWSEIDWDKAEWKIPAARMKGKKAHSVPLVPEMVAVLEAQREWQKKADPERYPDMRRTAYIFTSTGLSPVSGFSKALQKLRHLASLEEPWVYHDFRRTLSTLMVEDLSVDADLVERILAHSRRGIEGVYNKATRLNDRRHAHQKWAEALMVKK